MIVLISTFIVWLPFFLRQTNWFGLMIPDSSMQYIYRNYDGPLYIVPAKTLYNPEAINQLGIEVPLPEKYFAAHLPFYPLLIRLFSLFFGYLKSMLFVNLLSTIFLTGFFYYLLKKFKLTKFPFILSMVFLFHPKFLIVRSIGAPESLFIFFILLSLFFFEKKYFFLSGLFGGLATMTKIPGILLFPAFSLTIFEYWLKNKKINWMVIGLLLIPLGLILTFFLYYYQYNDFFAYFNTNAVVPTPYPFSVFNFRGKWVDTPWVEGIVLYFFFYALSIVYLYKIKQKSFFYFALIFFLFLLWVQHRDIPRYSLPIWPMALIAFEKFFTDKKFFLVFLFLLPALYLFAWNFIVYNILPISNWAPYL